MNRQDVEILLDKAKAKSGSDYKTAHELGVSRGSLCDWRKGKRPMPVADVALAAHMAGLDAVEWCSRATAAQHEGTAQINGKQGRPFAWGGAPHTPTAVYQETAPGAG